MSARRTLVALLLAFAFASGGCAVGNFITGAPSSSRTTPANSLVARRCSSCHEAPDPAAMSPAAWQAGLDRMKLRMRLPASEWDSLAAIKSGEAER